MIQKLHVKASFASSGFTLESEFQPQSGITAVVGPNGAGKTFSTIEATRYLIYGKKALRGKAADYKNLVVTGTLVINGEEYTATRSAKKEELTDANGTVLAVNAEAVTAKFVELIGYPLEVFDVCNASVQWNTALFGKMRASERKALIDKLVGLSSNEIVEKACRNEAALHRRDLETLTKALVAPVPPTVAFPGAFSDDIEKELSSGRKARREYDLLASKVRHIPKPVAPDIPRPNPIDIKIISQHEDERRDNERERDRLKATLQNAQPFTPYTVEELEAAKARKQKRRLIASLGDKANLTLEQIEQFEREWFLYEQHEVSDEVTCPNCGNMFHPTGEAPLKPAVSRQLLAAERKALSRWEDMDETLPEGLDLTNEEIEHGYKAHIATKAREGVLQRLEEIPALPDRSAQLDALRGLHAAWRAYDDAMIVYERESELEKQLSELEEPQLTAEELDSLTQKLADARLFESQWAVYDKQVIAFDKLTAEIADKQKLADDFKKGGEAMAEARAEIKAFLAPAMSRVASDILSDMTNGKFQDLSIDDDMNIMVGSQTLETLSGGQATIANIALRVALGRVLIGDVFPVFLGDEIDSDIDGMTRESLAAALVGLKKYLKQIIIVTHRGIDLADHIHDMGDL